MSWPIAITSTAWTTKWSDDSLALIDRAAALGFDALEIQIDDPAVIDTEAIAEHADDMDMKVIASMVCRAPVDPTADDPATRRYTADRLCRCVDAAAAMGSNLLTGVVYSALGRRTEALPDHQIIARAVQVLRIVARHAAEQGVSLGIEPVNRYESFLINRTDQAVEVIRQIGEPNVAIHLDTFHMHIEERDLAGAVRHAAGQLCHVHLVESDRGPLGGGGIDWTAFLDALSDAKYTGMIGLELLCDDLLAPNCSWNATPVGNDDSRIGQSLNTLRRMIEPYREPPSPSERT